MGKVKSVSKLLSLKKPTPPKKQSKPKKFDSTSTVQKFEPSWTGKEIDRKQFQTQWSEGRSTPPRFHEKGIAAWEKKLQRTVKKHGSSEGNLTSELHKVRQAQDIADWGDHEGRFNKRYTNMPKVYKRFDLGD